MLVLTRKLNESFCIGEDIKVIITKIKCGRDKGNQYVKLAISAPLNVKILRSELTELPDMPTPGGWNKTADGYPTDETPVLVSNGDDVFAALAVWVQADETDGWLWEVLDWGSHPALNAADEYVSDDDYQFEYWMPMPRPPEKRK